MTFTYGDICQQTRLAGGWKPATNEAARYMGHHMHETHVVSWQRPGWLLVADLATNHTYRELRGPVPDLMAGDLAGSNEAQAVTLYDMSGHEPVKVGSAYTVDIVRALIETTAP